MYEAEPNGDRQPALSICALSTAIADVTSAHDFDPPLRLAVT
jgi:hypothetical protein